MQFWHSTTTQPHFGLPSYLVQIFDEYTKFAGFSPGIVTGKVSERSDLLLWGRQYLLAAR